MLLGCLVGQAATSPFAQVPEQPLAAYPQRDKIGLILSEGGARGVAHVGVLKVLHELRIPIDFVAGNSMGALVGGNFAFGYSPAELQLILETIDWPLVLSDGSQRSDLSFRRKQDDADFGEVDLSLFGLQAFSRGRTALLLLGAVSSVIDGELPAYKDKSVDGFLNLSGTERNALRGT